jgi:hypothetical protein
MRPVKAIAEQVKLALAPGAWRKVLPIHPVATKVPEATDDERRGLAGDLRRNDLKVPIVLVRVAGARPQLLDGRHRLDLLEGIGKKVIDEDGNLLVPHEIVHVANDDEAERHSLSYNCHRRHLTREQKRELIANLLTAHPEKSNRQIAETVKADHKTVASVRAEKEAAGEIPQLEKTVGEDGKARQQPAKKNRKPGTTHMLEDEHGTPRRVSKEVFEAAINDTDYAMLEPRRARTESARLAQRAEDVIGELVSILAMAQKRPDWLDLDRLGEQLMTKATAFIELAQRRRA